MVAERTCTTDLPFPPSHPLLVSPALTLCVVARLPCLPAECLEIEVELLALVNGFRGGVLNAFFFSFLFFGLLSFGFRPERGLTLNQASCSCYANS